MKLNKQEIAVIRLLMANDDYVSSYEISASSGISRRMVREIVPLLRDRLAQEGIELESRTNKGYRLSGLTLQTRNRLLEMIEEGEKSVSQIPDDMLNRQIYINRRLIEADDYILVDDLADELLLSRTAVSSLLKDIRIVLKKYSLTIEQRPYHGIRMLGNEIDKRHALTDFNFTAFSDTAMFYDFMDTLAADETAWERDVLDVFRRYDIIFTDIALCDLLISIAVQMTRIVSGNELKEYVLQDVKENSEEAAAAREIAFSIKNLNFCELNENEIRALAAAIACKRSAVHMSFDDHDADEVSERIFEQIMKSTFVDYRASAKKGLIVQAVRHVMRQLRCDEKIRTEMWNTAFTRYPLAYSHALCAAEILTAETGKTCGKSHIVYLTQAFQSVMRETEKPPLKALFICGHTDVGSHILTMSIENRISPFAHITNTIQYYQLYEEDLSAYDLIISTISIHKPLPLPYICISQWVNEDDLNTVESFMHSRFRMCIPTFRFHPGLYADHLDGSDLKETRKIIAQKIASVYGETTMNFSRITEKDLNTEVIQNTVLAETVREMPCRCPWCILVFDKPLKHGRKSISAAVIYFGRKDSWEYHEIRKLIADRLQQADEKKIREIFSSYISFLRFLSD